MQRRLIGRAAAAAVAALILTTVSASADTVPADGDAVTPGNQTFFDLGRAGPGQEITVPVSFSLTCSGLTHAVPGDTILLSLSGGTVPLDGAATVTSTSIGPVPSTWTAAGEACPFPAPTLPSNGPSTVTLRVPTTPGDDYQFTLTWSRDGTTGLTGMTAMTFQVDVVVNTPPNLVLPSNQIVEATSAAGAIATFTATATDAEDASSPTPTCNPASGSTFPLGTTSVACSVTDSGGLVDSGTFDVTVVDTTAPSLVGMPGNMTLTTSDLSGTTLVYAAPTATDLVDPSPVVACSPVNGSTIPVGATTVTCTATDAAGNKDSASFAVQVNFVSAVVWTAVWGEPVATSNATFVANTGRTVPVKVEMFANGVEQTSGRGALSVAACTGGAVQTVGLTWDGGRWVGHLDTGTLAGPGCYVAAASLDGNVAGSFRLDLRGDAGAASATAKGQTRP